MQFARTVFRAAVEAKNWTLPIIHRLQRHATGTPRRIRPSSASTAARKTRCWARKKWSSVAATVADQPGPYPDDFDRAWKSVLFNQFHDIMGGTSLKPPTTTRRTLSAKPYPIADRNLNYAGASAGMEHPGEEQAGVHPMVVFNPHAWPVRANGELETNRIDTAVLLDDEEMLCPIKPCARLRSPIAAA